MKEENQTFNAEEIKKAAEITKENLLIRQTKKPPMSQRLTMSVSGLIRYCNSTLFLCKQLEIAQGKIRDLELGIMKAIGILKG